MRYDECFANRNGECLILKQSKCAKSEKCKFLKTKEELQKEIERCDEHLRKIGYYND